MNVIMEAISGISIKTPQLIGILCGIAVFTITITMVICLLIKSGTLQGALREIQGISPDSSSFLSSKNMPPNFRRPPGLHDHLILAAKTLPMCPTVADLMQCTGVNVFPLNAKTHAKELCRASDGTALFHESAYDAFERLWQWVDLAPAVVKYTEPPTAKESQTQTQDQTLPDYKGVPTSAPATSVSAHLHWPDAAPPYLSETLFKAWYEHAPADAKHLCIEDNELGRLVGMFTLASNRPHDLSIEICNVWITPAFRKSSTTAGGAARPPHAQIAVYLTLCAVFDSNYRRVTMHVATANIAGRKFAEACGFQLEGIHRKHRIAHGANQDSCAYALLNSDWPAVKFAWERRLDMKPVPEDSASSSMPAPLTAAATSVIIGPAASVASAEPTDSSSQSTVRKRLKTHIFDKSTDARPTWTDVQGNSWTLDDCSSGGPA